MAHDYVVVFWGGWTGHVRVAIVGSGHLSSTPWLLPGRLSLPLWSGGRAWFDYLLCLACCPWFALRGVGVEITPGVRFDPSVQSIVVNCVGHGLLGYVHVASCVGRDIQLEWGHCRPLRGPGPHLHRRVP